MEYAGKAFPEKLGDLREALAEDYLAMVLTEQDEIAWLFNLRGEGDSVLESLYVSPLFQSVALVDAGGEEAVLWLHGDKVNSAVRSHLVDEGVEIRQGFPRNRKMLSRMQLLYIT